MGLLSKFIGFMDIVATSAKEANNYTMKSSSGMYILNDEQGKTVDMFTVSTNNMRCVHIYVDTKQHCTIDKIETVKEQELYKIHATDHYDRPRQFDMIRV